MYSKNVWFDGYRIQILGGNKRRSDNTGCHHKWKHGLFSPCPVSSFLSTVKSLKLFFSPSSFRPYGEELRESAGYVLVLSPRCGVLSNIVLEAEVVDLWSPLSSSCSITCSSTDVGKTRVALQVSFSLVYTLRHLLRIFSGGWGRRGWGVGVEQICVCLECQDAGSQYQ